MIALAIDTSGSFCSACIYDDAVKKARATISEDIGRGHAERLMGTVSQCLKNAGVSYDDLDRVVVSIGPGSFTGIRVSVATARGFGLALGIPVTGISVFEVLLANANIAVPTGGVIMAGRDIAYCQFNVTSAFAAANEPFLAGLEELAQSELIRLPGLTLCGSGAEEFAKLLDTEVQVVAGNSEVQIEDMARLGLAKQPDGTRPEPLYLRKPDAKPQQKFAVKRTGG